MAHPEQREFVFRAKKFIDSQTRIRSIVEFGSYGVNGEIRSLFQNTNLSTYIGVDLIEGPGVDLVGFAHEIEHSFEAFDLAISVNVFEHDEYWELSFKKMLELVKPGGWIIFSCASRGFP